MSLVYLTSTEIHARARRREFLAEAERSRAIVAGSAVPRVAATRRAAVRWGGVVRVIRGGMASPDPAPFSPAA